MHDDAHQEKRRRTEVTSDAFERGLPENRPQFGYGRMADEKEPLATYIQGLLDEKEEPIEIPKERELRAYEKKKEPAVLKPSGVHRRALQPNRCTASLDAPASAAYCTTKIRYLKICTVCHLRGYSALATRSAPRGKGS